MRGFGRISSGTGLLLQHFRYRKELRLQHFRYRKELRLQYFIHVRRADINPSRCGLYKYNISRTSAVRQDWFNMSSKRQLCFKTICKLKQSRYWEHNQSNIAKFWFCLLIGWLSVWLAVCLAGCLPGWNYTFTANLQLHQNHFMNNCSVLALVPAAM